MLLLGHWGRWTAELGEVVLGLHAVVVAEVAAGHEALVLLGAGVVGILVCAIMIILGRRNRSATIVSAAACSSREPCPLPRSCWGCLASCPSPGAP